MALSNLIWWPWHGFTAGGPPPVVPEYHPVGDITPGDVQGRTGPPPRGFRRRLLEDEDDFISLLMDL